MCAESGSGVYSQRVWLIVFVVFVHITKQNHAARHCVWSVSNENFNYLYFHSVPCFDPSE